MDPSIHALFIGMGALFIGMGIGGGLVLLSFAVSHFFVK